MASDFATNPTTSATAADISYNAIITDMVLDALMANVVTPALLDVHDLAGKPSRSVKIPKADKFTAAAVAENTELQNTALTTSSVTLTTSEIGIQATITDVLEASDIPAAHGARLRQLGRSIGDKIDIDICALFGGFSQGIGTTNTAFNLDEVLEGIYLLEANDAANLGPLVMVGHPRQLHDVRVDILAEDGVILTNASGSPEQASRVLKRAEAGYFGSWFDVDMYQSTNVPLANATVDRLGGMFTKNYALAMAKKWDARVETLRWPSIRGWVIVATANYGVGEVEDLAGLKVTSKAAL